MSFESSQKHSPSPQVSLQKRAPGERGFTLVELLVVIAIIALLAGMLLPTLGRTKALGKSSCCLNNLRQMAIAAGVYTGDNGEYYPQSYQYRQKEGVFASIAWDLTTFQEGGLNVVKPGLLWEGHGAVKIQQCPAFSGEANWAVDPYTGYNYNTSYIGHGQYESIPEPAKTTEILHPVRTVIFGDGEYSGGANKFMRAPYSNPGDADFSGRWSGTQGFRHLKRTNAAFCDGHTESLKRRFVSNEDGSENVAPGTGFLSEDNALYDPKS